MSVKKPPVVQKYLADRTRGGWHSLVSGSEYTQLSVKTLRRAISRGDLPASKVGQLIRIAESDLDAWITRQQLPTGKRTPRSASRGGDQPR